MSILKIKICTKHKKKEKTPLLTNVAFDKPFWCPACGTLYDHEDAQEVYKTRKLNRLKKLYEESSQSFLDAITLINANEFKNPDTGNMIHFRDLPEEIQESLQRKVNAYKYRYNENH